MRKIWMTVGVISLIIIAFTLGFLGGRRERINNDPDNIVVVSSNNSIQNSLTAIETRPILAAPNARDVSSFGDLYFKVISETKTEILIRLDDVPNQIIPIDGNTSINIPNELEIKTAIRSADGLDYTFETIGTIVLNLQDGALRRGEFSTIIDSDLIAIERIWFTHTEGGQENIFVDQSPDLPPSVRGRPAPYFWVIV